MRLSRAVNLLLLVAVLVGAFAVLLVRSRELAAQSAVIQAGSDDVTVREKEKRAAPLPAAAQPAAPRVFSTILEEDFESWAPPGWSVVDNGGDCVWESTAVTGRANYAGGDGQAAVADSDWCGFDHMMDTELRTPTMDLAAHGGGTLEFVAAYNWWSSGEYLDVDVSSDGGGSWTNLLHWTEDHDPYGPGWLVSLDLGPHATESVVVRFHYGAPGWQFYALIDQVRVLPPVPDLSRSYKLSAGLAMPGQPLTYTLVVSNTATAPATDVSLVDPIPLSTTFAYTVGPVSLIYNSSENQVEWTGSLGRGESIELSFVVTPGGSVGCGRALTNTATISQSHIPSTVILQQVTQVTDRAYYVTNLEDDGGGFESGGSNSSWAWGVPNSGPRKAHSGARVWATNLQGTYNNGEDSFLASPVVDLSNAVDVPGFGLWLRWWDWFWSEACCDYGVVEARGGGVDWTAVSGPFRGIFGGWTEHKADLSAFAGASDFQFRFRLVSDETVALNGWYVDDIAVYQCAPPPGLYLWPRQVETEGCVGVSQTHPFHAHNATGADGVFSLTHALLEPAHATLEGPKALSLTDQTGATFAITLTPDLCLPDGLELLATVEANGNGYSDSLHITKTMTTGVSCPVCSEMGWLEGHVTDYDGFSAPCGEATVHVEPGSTQLDVDESGYYTGSLVPFDYEVTAWASGYPEPAGPLAVTVSDGQISTLNLVLDRSDLAATPPLLVAQAAVPHTATEAFTITNQGTYTLTYKIGEIVLAGGGDSGPEAGVTAEQPGSGSRAVEVESSLVAALEADETAGYLIYFRERPDLSPAFEMDWSQRGWFVVEALRRAADRSQAHVRAYLDSQGADYQAFWVENVIVVNRSSQRTFDGLLGFAEVEALRAQRHSILYEPVQEIPASPDLAGIEPNIHHVGADRVWDELGITGEGIVVANIDTGVRYTHQALVGQYRGNLGNGSFDHDYNWLDPDTGNPLPYDDHNHGSHTMGIMVGDDGGANRVGMAPGAQWIACDACNVNGGCPDPALLACAQWIAAPYPVGNPGLPNPDLRPHIVNNSWGDCARSYDGWYRDVVDTWQAMGIYPIFSNGNSTNCGYPMPPGCNTTGNPGRYGNVTGVGSSGRDSGQYASHSNWGPTDDPDTLNPRGYPDLKPQVLAPGVSIRSAYKSGDAVYGLMTGTSMSAPHVSGLVALMWSAAPCLRGDFPTTETIIEQTATPIPYPTNCDGEGPGNVPNFAAGWGEINAYEAVDAAMDYCQTDWLPWARTDVVSGQIGSGGEQLVRVTFACTPTATQQTQPLEGTLGLIHNDPCQTAVEVPLTFFCYGQTPTPMWEKRIWINDEEVSPAGGPLAVSPGDRVRIVDRVGAAFSETITSVLTETWLDSLRLVEYDWDPAVAISREEQSSTLIWVLANMAPNTFYSVTKAFEVLGGDWVTSSITESYAVEGALKQPPDVVVVFRKQVSVYLPIVLKGP